MDELYFFDGKPDALFLYEAFRNKVLAEKGIGDVTIRVQKTQITFSNRHVFACVSQMRVRKKKELPPVYIVVTFGLCRELESSRIAAKTEPYPNRWTHHVVIGDENDIDSELMGWIREAGQFAMNK